MRSYIKHGSHGRVGSSVGDEDVDSAHLLDGLSDQFVAVFGLGNVASQSFNPEEEKILVSLFTLIIIISNDLLEQDIK